MRITKPFILKLVDRTVTIVQRSIIKDVSQSKSLGYSGIKTYFDNISNDINLTNFFLKALIYQNISVQIFYYCLKNIVSKSTADLIWRFICLQVFPLLSVLAGSSRGAGLETAACAQYCLCASLN